MLAHIIAVGEEVLSGDVVNSNAATISRALSDIGIFCRYHHVVGDVESDIVTTMKQASEEAGVIVLCGGLGPTKDDLTREAVATFLGRKLYEDATLKQELEAWFERRGYQVTENNYKQSQMIEGGCSLPNPNGTAPGMSIELPNTHIFLLPGPPRELTPMLHDYVIPILSKDSQDVICTKTFKMIGIGESQAVTIIDDIIQAGERFIVAPYAKLREVHIKVTSIEADETRCRLKMEPVEAIIRERLGDYIYTETEEDLIEYLLGVLSDKNAKLYMAESCTGGLMATQIVEKSGASSVFMEGIVTYSNASKVKRLGVLQESLDNFGAVSEQVAKEMVQGLAKDDDSAYCVSVTGIAGPTGGTEEKPVGLVYIGIRTPKGIHVYENHFQGKRQMIREAAAKTAWISLYQCLLADV